MIFLTAVKEPFCTSVIQVVQQLPFPTVNHLAGFLSSSAFVTELAPLLERYLWLFRVNPRMSLNLNLRRLPPSSASVVAAGRLGGVAGACERDETRKGK
ncbi:hypothetical protein L1987_57982 [Smallanthus sonchifolius]|uniref:Uncharacterized protein n=1 Tax=Smallanthus sonchifolius TaxID=185202 RepID=A0ACB9DEH1_9ASTR|nr:hypothetical protein L1987_57982 [Smallanthus sonchifolius]